MASVLARAYVKKALEGRRGARQCASDEVKTVMKHFSPFRGDNPGSLKPREWPKLVNKCENGWSELKALGKGSVRNSMSEEKDF